MRNYALTSGRAAAASALVQRAGRYGRGTVGKQVVQFADKRGIPTYLLRQHEDAAMDHTGTTDQ